MFINVYFVVVFFVGCIDLTDQSSFERAKFWVNELKQTEEVSSLEWREATKNIIHDEKESI